MTREEVFAIWAPEESAWSRWAKPVLFAHMEPCPDVAPALPETAEQVFRSLSLDEKTALVINLPGLESVHAGLALAMRGFRPVPLFNAIPLPLGAPSVDIMTGRKVAAVEVLPIMRAMQAGAGELAAANLRLDAPPAFLLDADRRGDGRKVLPDEFDNRSICFTTDFPSANFLISFGMHRILLIQKSEGPLQQDLSHQLRRWQDAGMVMEILPMDAPEKSCALSVPKPSWYGAMFQRALSVIGFHRSSGGGFGAWVPESSSGG
jgi:hypothetical protein